MKPITIGAIVLTGAIAAIIAWRTFSQTAKPGNQPLEFERTPTRLDGGRECKYGPSITASIICNDSYCRDSDNYEDDQMQKEVSLSLVQITDETCIYKVDDLFFTSKTASTCDSRNWKSQALEIKLLGVNEDDILEQETNLSPENISFPSRCALSMRVVLIKEDVEPEPFDPVD